MKVFKFGGASVRSAGGVRNIAEILREEKGPVFVIVSAMGKTTNALEAVLGCLMTGNGGEAMELWQGVEASHREIIAGLVGGGNSMEPVEALFGEVRMVLEREKPYMQDYDKWYDRIVSYGELISTRIVSTYLESAGIHNRWVDMRRCLITDDRHRDANVNIDRSTPLLRKEIERAGAELLIGQGFIGASKSGEPTTLGREGSDYSAAVVANMIDAESVTIWKDVAGILSADPKMFDNAQFIPELTYLDAIELAYSGAQIIHPKTIKPLQNKHIPLYVRPFDDITAPGSVIKDEVSKPIDIPILILKKNQVLVSVRPKDFSFVLEDRIGSIISSFESERLKINLVQSSAVNFSVLVDASHRLQGVIDKLKQDFRVVFNDNMELLTIRGYTKELFTYYVEHADVYLTQRTRRIVRIVRKAQ